MELTPKAVIILNTMVAVVVISIAIQGIAFARHRKPASSPAPAPSATCKPAKPAEQISGGRFALATKDFGDPLETRRDACRAFSAGSIYCKAAGSTVATALKPKASMPTGVNADVLAVQHEALGVALREALGTELPPAALQRLLPMLTVNPALSALAACGELPMVLQNRFVVQARAAEDGAVAVHALTLGFIGTPLPGGRPDQKAAPNVLIVDSPNLSEAAPADDPLSFELRYSIRKAKHTSIEKETPAALASPPSGLP